MEVNTVDFLYRSEKVYRDSFSTRFRRDQLLGTIYLFFFFFSFVEFTVISHYGDGITECPRNYSKETQKFLVSRV